MRILLPFIVKLGSLCLTSRVSQHCIIFFVFRLCNSTGHESIEEEMRTYAEQATRGSQRGGKMLFGMPAFEEIQAAGLAILTTLCTQQWY